MANVTAIVKDPAGNIYANALVIASFVGQNTTPGAGPYISGGVPQGQFETVVPGNTDSFGALAMPITGNDTITPSPSQWKFTVVSSTTPSVSFAVLITITGASQDISAALQAAAAPLVMATSFGNITATGLTVAGLELVKNLEQTRYADQFTGADMGAKITAAIADLPATGGIVDATAFQGAQSAAATININKPCTIKIGSVTLLLSGTPGINLSNMGAALIGLGPGASILQANTGSSDVIQSNAINVMAKGFSINSAVARTFGAGIRCKGGNGVYEDFTIDKTWNGIQVTDSLSGASGNNIFKRIVMGSLASPAGTWNAGIILGNVAAGTVTGEFFQDVVVIGTSVFADAMCVLDSGCDTNHFTDCQFVQSGTDSFCLSVRNTNTSNAPQWNKFLNCAFESGPTKTGVTHSAGILNNFIDCTLATCGVFFQFNGGTSVHVVECKMVGCQQQAVNITAGNDIRITNNRIADSSLQTNGGFNTIQVTANVNDFSISGNDFTTILSSANQPFQNISIPAGTSDRYWIYANTLANFTNVGISDGGTGTNKLVGFNSPFSAGSSKLYGVDLTQASSLNKTTLLNSQDAAAALTGDGTDKTFYTFTLPAATLAAGKGVRVSAFWVHGTGVASITYKLFFGATAVVNAASAVTGNGCFDAIIMNQPASIVAQRASSKFTPTGTATSVTSGNAPAENTANAVVIKATFNVANTDQITPAQWVVELVQ